MWSLKWKTKKRTPSRIVAIVNGFLVSAMCVWMLVFSVTIFKSDPLASAFMFCVSLLGFPGGVTMFYYLGIKNQLDPYAEVPIDYDYLYVALVKKDLPIVLSHSLASSFIRLLVVALLIGVGLFIVACATNASVNYGKSKHIGMAIGLGVLAVAAIVLLRGLLIAFNYCRVDARGVEYRKNLLLSKKFLAWGEVETVSLLSFFGRKSVALLTAERVTTMPAVRIPAEDLFYLLTKCKDHFRVAALKP